MNQKYVNEVINKYSRGLKNIFYNKKKIIKKKFNNIPENFLEVFQIDNYLKVNPDIKEAIEKGYFINGLEHFILFGIKEVKEGKRRIGKEFPYFNEEVYMNYNPDLKEVKKKNPEFDLYRHFLEYGYKEYLDGLRIGIGYFDFEFSENLQNKFKNIFDEKSYLNINSDVKEAVKKGLFKNGWEHFVKYGVYEVRRGERQINSKISKFNEIEYLIWFGDIQKAIREHIITSPFEHFLLYGYKEIIEGKRVFPNSSIYIYYGPKLNEKIKKKIKNFNKKPLISIIMPVYNVDVKWLDLAIKSVKEQWYENWELCIVDDASTKKETKNFLQEIDNPKIKIKFLEKNKGISGASNEALKLAKGEYIALMDNDDELTFDALYEVVKAINEQGAEFIYSDEDKIEIDGEFVEPHFKPDFAPDMFLAQNYISHLGVIKRELVEKVGGWEIGLEGSQDYDLYLKILEHTNKIYHIPKVLYHWRKIPGSTAAEYSQKSYAQESGRKALENAMKRRKIKAKVKNGLTPGTYKIEYELRNKPLVSIIIPFKDKSELLRQCINSIISKTTYQNFEIIGISNNSVQKETFDEMKRLEKLDKRIKFYEYNVPFNYSKINNYAVKYYANGEHIIFMNNDIEIITSNWIEEMLMFSQRENVGAVGAKLYYPDNTIQHAGLVIVPKTAHRIMNVFSRFSKDDYGYFSRLKCINNYNAVTAALMMVKKQLFEEVNGFDEENLKIAYNDVDFCLKLREKDYLNIWTPFCEAYHYESLSRGQDNTIEKIERLRGELEKLKQKHTTLLYQDDVYYNPNLTYKKDNFSISEINTINREKYIEKPFKEKILIKKVFRDKIKDKLAIFVHYDKYNIIDNYIINYLKELNQYFDILFVSTAEGMNEKELEKISLYCNVAIVKENYGYDFGAWKTGLDFMGEKLNEYDGVLMCNDSVYGPLFDLKDIIIRMKDYDVFALTDNFEIDYHYQSYFIYYSKKAINNENFKKFWHNFKIYEDKFTLIQHCEIDYTRSLIFDSSLKNGVYFSSKGKTYLNMMHYYWKELILNKFPFIKVELLRDNPMNIDIKEWETIINNTEYNLTYIKNHLKRIKK